MAVDLIHELDDIELGHSDETSTMLKTNSNDIEGFLEIKDTLKSYINQIKNNAKLVDQYIDQYKISSSKSEYIAITNKIDIIVQNNTNITTNTRTMITAEKQRICHTETSSQSLVVIEFNNLVETFRKTTHVFHTSLNRFEKAVGEKQMRQILFLNVDNKNIERLNQCNYQQRQQWIEKKMELADDRTLERLVDLEEQREGMLAIEKSINELKELYEHLNILIVDQGMLIDKIEKETEYTHDQVQQGRTYLTDAEIKQKKTRKMKCWCIAVLLMVIVTIFLLILFRN